MVRGMERDCLETGTETSWACRCVFSSRVFGGLSHLFGAVHCTFSGARSLYNEMYPRGHRSGKYGGFFLRKFQFFARPSPAVLALYLSRQGFIQAVLFPLQRSSRTLCTHELVGMCSTANLQMFTPKRFRTHDFAVTVAGFVVIHCRPPGGPASTLYIHTKRPTHC